MFEPQNAPLERDDFCSLAPIGWLHHKMQDSFFLVVGTGSCQGFLQTALGVMIFAQPRFATALLDEDDLAGRDPLSALLPIARQVVEEHRPRAIFLGSTCTPEILKMNIAGCAPPLERETGVRVYPARMDGFDPSYTQGEDHVLGAMVQRAPQGNERNLVILGCLSALEEAEIRLECRAMGLPEPAFLPAESALDLPPIGKETVLAPVHPFLYDTCAYAVRERGVRVPPTVFPYGPDGARAFYESLAAAFGKTVSYEAREREAWAACERELASLRGRSVAFCSDAMLELPLARTLRAGGVHVPFVATPRIYKKFHARESALLAGVDVLEAPDRFETFARLSSERPDLVVANLNIANALEGMGFNVQVVDGTLVPADPVLLRSARALQTLLRRAAPPRCARAHARSGRKHCQSDRPRLLPRHPRSGAGERRVKLAVWAYQAPAHVGVTRAASSFAGIHTVLRAPKGDGYGTIMLAMFERLGVAPPITVCAMSEATLAGAAADIGRAIADADQRLHPEMIVVTRSATAAVLQEPLDGEIAMIPAGMIAAEIFQPDTHPVRDNETSAFAKTVCQIVDHFAQDGHRRTAKPSVNIIGPSLLGFHDHSNIESLRHMFEDIGVTVNAVIPLGASPAELRLAGTAWLNVSTAFELSEPTLARPAGAVRNAVHRAAAVRRERHDAVSARGRANSGAAP